jgi:CheY-like chemotaxis protein
VLILLLIGPIVRTLEQNAISKVGLAGFSVEFVHQQIEHAGRAKNQDIPAALHNRIERTSRKMFDVSVMWLDDEPVINSAARRAMSSLGITVDLARSTEEALELIADSKYAIMITDQNRKKEKNTATCFPGSRGQPVDDRGQPIANAGCYFVQEAKKLFKKRNEPMPPIIIYTSKEYPDLGVPTYAFGITTKVDEVFHLMLDALERRHTPDAPWPIGE